MGKTVFQGLKERSVLMAILLTVACFLTYYFHAVLEVGTVFTHFFYIPIILASLWWQRRGLFVAVFLAAFLIFSHLLFRTEALTPNDYLRAAMFIVIAFAVAILSERIAKSEDRTEHLNLILRAIRNVNQLIVREKDREKLIQGICDNLVGTRGYFNAWIALLDESGKLAAHAECGLGKSFLPMVERQKRGEFTDCGQRALKQPEAVVIEDPVSTCTDCPLSSSYAGRSAVIARLEYEGKVYGLLAVSIPGETAHDVEELGLFHEVATDIVFALHNMELEEERKQAEEVLRESEERFHIASQIASDVVYERDLQTGIATFYGDMDSHLGYEPGEYPRTMEGWREHVHPEDLAWIDRQSIDQLEPGVPHGIEYRMRKKDGTYMTWFDQIMVIWDEKAGKPLKMIGAATDITERKQAEEELRQSEERYKAIFELGSDVGEAIIINQDMPGQIAAQPIFNDEWIRITGYNRDELLRMSYFDLIHPAQRDAAINRYHRRLQGKKIHGSLELTVVRKDGTEIQIETTATLTNFRGQNATIVYARDITERKKAETALRQSEEFNSSVLRNSPNPVIVANPDTSIRYVNPALENLTGYSLDELVGQKTPRPWWLEEMYEKLESSTKTAYRRGFKDLERCFQKKSGELFWVQITAAPVIIDGEFSHFIANWVDITARKRMEEELADEATRRRILVEQSSDGIVILDQGGKVYESNRRFAEMLGYSIEEVLQLHVFDWEFQFPPEQVLDMIQTVDETGDHFETKHRRKDGTIYDVEISTNAAVFAGQKLIFCVCRDITEHKQVEEERTKYAKLESVGTLAGGIAHDFNNILTGILGNISLAMRHVEPKSKAEERLLEAEKASIRARDLTQQLLTFSRGGAPVKNIVSIAGLLKESVGFALRGSSIRCDFDLPDNLWPVEVDEGQINQVITNIIINAQEAMPEGGVINITAGNTVVQGRSTLPLSKGRYVLITVVDQGVGIRKDHLDRIFDPYFTTKQKGSGLGLATSYSIVKAHGGYITVDSTLGVGTAFQIYLPASKESVSVEKEDKAEGVTTGEGRILVMDDEEMVRDLLYAELTEVGYNVELASDGAEAIEQYTKARESEKPFDAVILDLTIPGGMGGKEAIKKLLEIDPDVKAIVSSGYATDPIMSDFKKYGFRAVVTKPYSVAQIEKTLHGLLGKKK